MKDLQAEIQELRKTSTVVDPVKDSAEMTDHRSLVVSVADATPIASVSDGKRKRKATVDGDVPQRKSRKTQKSCVIDYDNVRRSERVKKHKV